MWQRFVLTSRLFQVRSRVDTASADFLCVSPLSHQLKYKAEYVKQRGHYVGVPKMRDDPKLVWYEHAGEIQNDRLYKSDYNKTKSKIHMPSDAMAVVAAKECQSLVSDVEYRHYLHQWTCLPDQNNVIHARQAYDLQSDVSDAAALRAPFHLLWPKDVAQST